jgi:hypothetical protein
MNKTLFYFFGTVRQLKARLAVLELMDTINL